MRTARPFTIPVSRLLRFTHERDQSETTWLVRVKGVQAAADARDWSKMMLLCERPMRWTVFRALAPCLDDTEYWQTLRYVWVDTESLWQIGDVRRLLNAKRSNRHALMNDAERAQLMTLPDVVAIYRGCLAHNREGWSWSLDPAKALWFARRFAAVFDMPPFVIRASVDKQHIIALFDERKEAEVVCDPHTLRVESINPDTASPPPSLSR